MIVFWLDETIPAPSISGPIPTPPTNAPTNKVVIYVVSSLVLILVICIVLLWVRSRRGRKLLNEFEAAGFLNFEDGNPACIDPNLGLEVQADLLPYDKQYEFPREHLKLGKRLGAGAYGVVFKAIAQNIQLKDTETTVAVKMANESIDFKVRLHDRNFLVQC